MNQQDNPQIETATLDLGPVRLEVALTAGPRILGYSRPGGAQLFATLPDAVLEHTAIGRYRLLGGHRLWRAPEAPAITYYPDDGQTIAFEETPGGLSLTGSPEPDGLTKTMRIRQHGSHTVVNHELHNQGSRPIRCAPWAITQLATGGQAFLPQTRNPIDRDGVLPNRHLVLWPYTDLSHPEIELRPDTVVVTGSTRPYNTKLGQPNQRGWIAYAKDDELFVKWAPHNDDSADYADYGATIQCYRDDRFVELETLGPLATIEPGQRIEHQETWLLVACNEQPIADMLAALPSSPVIDA